MSDTAVEVGLCRFPGCDHPVVSPPATGGRSRYCADPAHTAVTAFRARQSGRQPGGESGQPVAEDGDRPVTWAAIGLKDSVGRLERVLAEIGQAVSRATADLAVAGNVEATEAQLAAVRRRRRRRSPRR